MAPADPRTAHPVAPGTAGHALPRLVIAAAASSAGKTTVTTGLLAALTSRGVRAAGFKVGPDFIDPGYHALATGRPGRNLDPVMVGQERIAPLFLHGCRVPAPADIAIVEGVMGLFDGRLRTGGQGSTAHVAKLITAPVILVVDGAGSSRTAAAAALGLAAFDPNVQVAGVIVNRVASPAHGAELSQVFADAGMPVLGVLPRDPQIAAPSRHLGLVPASERLESAHTIAALARHVGAHVDLDAVQALARGAAPLAVEPWDPADEVTPVAGRPRIAVFGGRAFTFRYAETTELLEAAGCEVVEVDPLTDVRLPAGVAGLYIGGGFPEVHAADLSGNAGLRLDVADAVAAGVPTVAECAGQLYLGQHLDGHPMVGALAASARMTPRLTLGYRHAQAPAATLVSGPSAPDDAPGVWGHEFHRTQTLPAAGSDPAWVWNNSPAGFSLDPAGLGEPTLHSSYLHLHWAGTPQAAQRFADAASRHAARNQTPTAGPRPRPAEPDHDHDDDNDDHEPPATRDLGGIDLHHHGDRDVADGLIDLAVNVQTPGPRPWLARIIDATTATLGAYPSTDEAVAAIADAHGVDPSMVLPTAGGAEAFALVARALPLAHPLVVHPQFTEPEAALRAAGRAVQRWLLPVSPGADTPPLGELPGWADAVFVGNPTNPTGWLHRRADLLAAGQGRTLVVDEAFMDAAQEAESLIAPAMPGRLVLRSLSKTWGLAGLRVGYVVGDPDLVAALAAAQPPWPVSAPALAALVAVLDADSRAQASTRYAQVDADRAHLVAALEASGFGVVPSSAPFVLIDTSRLGPGSARAALAARGFAVRRGESFPGLGPTWIRVRVPDPATADAFVAALDALAQASLTAREQGNT